MKCNVKRFREISEEMGLGNPPVSADDWLNSSFCSSQRFPNIKHYLAISCFQLCLSKSAPRNIFRCLDLDSCACGPYKTE